MIFIASPFQVLSQSQIRVSSDPYPISPDNVRLLQPRYSPNGKWIAAAGIQYRGIALLDSSGHFVRWVTRMQSAGYQFRWSANSDKLLSRVFKTENKKRKSAIAIFPLQSDSLQLVTKWGRNYSLPEWCNQDRSIYFLKHDTLQVIDIANNKLTEEQNWIKYRFPGDVLPYNIMAYVKENRLVLKDYRGVFYAVIVYPEQRILNPILSPHDEWVAYELMGSGLQVAHRTGESMIHLGMYHHSNWNSSGDLIVSFAAKDDGLRIISSELYVHSIPYGETTQLTFTKEIQEQHPCWSPDGRFIICSDNINNRIYRLRVNVR